MKLLVQLIASAPALIRGPELRYIKGLSGRSNFRAGVCPKAPGFRTLTDLSGNSRFRKSRQ